jgi:catechol 2,3-dioxygenase-like lactoylglutathione lyase family enzyme
MKLFLTIVLLITISMPSSTQNTNDAHIEYQDVYSVYITKQLKVSKEFYVKWLDFEVLFEASWFVYLQSKGSRKLSFALIDVSHPSSPPAYGAFDGKGSFLTLQVGDAQSVYNKLKKNKAPITYQLTKEAWGQLRFGLTDPNGLYIDVVQRVEPEKGYWEKYMTRQ